MIPAGRRNWTSRKIPRSRRYFKRSLDAATRNFWGTALQGALVGRGREASNGGNSAQNAAAGASGQRAEASAGDRERFANGAPSLVDRHVGISACAGIRIRDHDSAEGRAADDVGLVGLVPVRIEQWIVFVGVAVRPAIDRDAYDVGRRIEPSRSKDARKLVANVALERLEAGGEQLRLSGAKLRSRVEAGAAWHAGHAH